MLKKIINIFKKEKVVEEPQEIKYDIQFDEVDIDNVNVETNFAFEVYVGLGDESNVQLANNHDFDTLEEAKQFGYEFAQSIYLAENYRDVMEIMEQEKVNEDEALRIFIKEMNEKITFFIHQETIMEPQGIKGLTRHYY